jgi:methylenetetrahydrofolate--tRNA-(uracil-5-)-methyltransferase
MADRGRETLRFGPMRPIGIEDPRTGRRPWAVVQLRPENREATMFNLVGFQTKMKYGEQKRVLSMIPGLENAEFLRMGSMHRNSFVDAPRVLNPSLSLKNAPQIYLAGQITGVEGYMESAATGILAAIFLEAELEGRKAPLPPRGTGLGAILAHLGNTASPDFQPMGINFGLFDETCFSETLEQVRASQPKRKKIPKAEKRAAIGNAALVNLKRYQEELHSLDEASARMRNSPHPFSEGALYDETKRNH